MVDQALNILIVRVVAARARTVQEQARVLEVADPRSHMHMLRKMVDGASGAKLLQTVTGSVYRLGAEHG